MGSICISFDGAGCRHCSNQLATIRVKGSSISISVLLTQPSCQASTHALPPTRSCRPFLFDGDAVRAPVGGWTGLQTCRHHQHSMPAARAICRTCCCQQARRWCISQCPQASQAHFRLVGLQLGTRPVVHRSADTSLSTKKVCMRSCRCCHYKNVTSLPLHTRRLCAQTAHLAKPCHGSILIRQKLWSRGTLWVRCCLYKACRGLSSKMLLLHHLYIFEVRVPGAHCSAVVVKCGADLVRFCRPGPSRLLTEGRSCRAVL